MLTGLSLLLGRQRDLVRRLGAIALIWLGVHAGADVLDDAAADALDAVDLAADAAIAAALERGAELGAWTAEAALRGIEASGSLVDIAEKQWLALRLALVVELGLVLALLPLAWGTRGLVGASAGAELRRSVFELRASLRALDIERFAAPPVLTAFVGAGAVVAAGALEQLVRSGLTSFAPGFARAGNASAALGIVVVALLLWRFLPDLLHGAIVRAHARGELERARSAARAGRRARSPGPRGVRHRLAPFVDTLHRFSRGLWLVPTGLVALGAIRAVNAAALLDRLGAVP